MPLKQVVEGKIEERIEGQEEEDDAISSSWMVLWKWEDTGIESWSSRLHSVDNLLWKRLWTCRKTDCGM